MKNLNETIPFMTSNDYKERFIAEYWQLKIRYEKLRTFNAKIEAARLCNRAQQEYAYTAESSADNKIPVLIEPKHDCPCALLSEQQHVMGQLLHLLEMRAIIENISLDISPDEITRERIQK